MDTTNYISAILTGDRVALERLYRTQLPVIRSLIRDQGGADADAEDVFQDAVLVIYRKAKQPDFELTSQFGTYFYSICRNLWLNRRTKKSASAEVTLTDDVKYTATETATDADTLYVERGNVFWRAFRQLGDDCQKLLELFFQKTPMEAIATQMGYGSEGYARRRKLQCKDRLAEMVKNDPAYGELV